MIDDGDHLAKNTALPGRATTAHVGALLPELVLGGLSAQAQATVRAHVACCSTCKIALDDWQALLDSFGAHLPHVPPRAELRDELMSRVDDFVDLPNDVAPWLDAFAVLFDLSYTQARKMLSTLRDPSGWQPMGVAGISMKPVQPGLRRTGSKACLLRVSPGTQFPEHRHEGQEHVLLLLGGLRENSGALQHAGELCEHASGTTHAFVALPGELCIAAVLYDQVTMLA